MLSLSKSRDREFNSFVCIEVKYLKTTLRFCFILFYTLVWPENTQCCREWGRRGEDSSAC